MTHLTANVPVRSATNDTETSGGADVVVHRMHPPSRRQEVPTPLIQTPARGRSACPWEGYFQLAHKILRRVRHAVGSIIMRQIFLLAFVWNAAVTPCAAGPEANHSQLSKVAEVSGESALPPGWQTFGASAMGFSVSVVGGAGRDTTMLKVQRINVRITRTGELGGVFWKYSAVPFRGQRVRLSARLRFEIPYGMAQFGNVRPFVSIRRANGQVAFADDGTRLAVRDSAWAVRQLAFDVPPLADSITVGFALDTFGTAWIESVRFASVSVAGEGDSPPRPASMAEIANITALARLLGYVRYFHPSSEAETVDWDSLTIASVEYVAASSSPGELRRRLLRVLRPVAPLVRLKARPLASCAAESDHSTSDLGELHRVVRWYFGYPETVGGTYYGKTIHLALTAHPDTLPRPGECISANLGRGVWCSVPLTLLANAVGTLPHRVRNLHDLRGVTRPPGWGPSAGDRATRLADVVILWNSVKHFYPYLDELGVDWDSLLPKMLSKAAVDADQAAFATTLTEMLACLRDGHTSLEAPGLDRRRLPLSWRFLNDSLIVDNVASAYRGVVNPGDCVLAIQGVPVDSLLLQVVRKANGSTPQRIRYRAASLLHTLFADDTLRLSVAEPNGRGREIVLPRLGQVIYPPRPDSISSLGEGVLYVDLCRTTDEDLDGVSAALQSARGVVFDLRGYPERLTRYVPAHLIDTPVAQREWYTRIVTRPDGEACRYDTSRAVTIPAQPRIRARVAFLVDASAISKAEYYLSPIEDYGLGALVGEPSAGSSGHVVSFGLPGGYVARFTCNRTRKRNRTPFTGVGIMPSHVISPTRIGIAEGRDEQLEWAVRYVSEH